MKDGSQNEIKGNIEESLKELIAAKGEKLNSVEFVEVSIPSDILKDGVVIVDSPGLNDPETERMDITYKFVKQADCVLYFMNSQQAWKKSEKDFLEEQILSKGDLDKVFFLLNYWDLLEEDDKEEVLEYVKEEISNSLQIVKKKLNNQNISTPPLIPISAKTGENFENLKTELFKYLLNQKAEDILNAKIKKLNSYINNYLEIIKSKEKLLLKDNEIILQEEKQKENELEEYRIKAKNTESKIYKAICNKYEDFTDDIQKEYKHLVSSFENNLRNAKIDKKEDLEKNLKIELKRAEQGSFENIQHPLKKFRREILAIFDKERSDLNIPVSKIINDDYLINKLTNIDANITDRSKVAESLAAGTGILSVVGGSTVGINMLMAPTVIAGSEGIIGSVSAFFAGTTATTAAGMSATAIAGIACIPLAIIGAGAYVAFKNSSREKFQKDLQNVIKEITIKLNESYTQKSKEIKKDIDKVAEIITMNISNEFQELYKIKLDEFKEIKKLKENSTNLDKFNGISKEVETLYLTL
jgi:hypothetical protein